MTDDLYTKAVEMVIENQKVSTATLQRKFKIKYSHAVSIIEALECAGIVSEIKSNGTRDVLIQKL
jgi:S-DNA-T family DNA segregation ATPase FtsK/SpoIIIE